MNNYPVPMKNGLVLVEISGLPSACDNFLETVIFGSDVKLVSTVAGWNSGSDLQMDPAHFAVLIDCKEAV